MKKLLSYLPIALVSIVLLLLVGLTVYNHQNAAEQKADRQESIDYFLDLHDISRAEYSMNAQFNIPVHDGQRDALFYPSRSAVSRLTDQMHAYEVYTEMGASCDRSKLLSRQCNIYILYESNLFYMEYDFDLIDITFGDQDRGNPTIIEKKALS